MTETIRELLEDRTKKSSKFGETLSALLEMEDEDLADYWAYGLGRCEALSDYNKRQGNQYGSISSPVDWILSCTSRFLYTDWLLVKQTREKQKQELAEQESIWRKKKEEQQRAKELAKKEAIVPKRLRDVRLGALSEMEQVKSKG